MRGIYWMYHLRPFIIGLSKRQTLVGIAKSNASRQRLVDTIEVRECKTIGNSEDCVKLQNTYLI